MTEKYEKHGLTRDEDGILGSFGHVGRLDEPALLEELYNVSPNAVESLKTKDLIYEDPPGELHLTLKGKKLWKIRANEELEPPRKDIHSELRRKR